MNIFISNHDYVIDDDDDYLLRNLINVQATIRLPLFWSENRRSPFSQTIKDNEKYAAET